MKASDEFLVPLCIHGHHDQIDGRAKLPDGRVGREAFLDFYRYDADARAAEFHAKWEQRSRQDERAQ